MNITKPAIPEVLSDSDLFDAIRKNQVEEAELEELKITGSYENEDFTHLAFGKTVFDRCRLTGCDFSNCDFIDVRFTGCDITGCRFADSYFSRVAMDNLKAVGAVFSGAVLKNLSVADSNFSYAVFSKAKLEKVSLSGQFHDGSFAECQLKGFEFGKADLKRADFFKTPLKGLDLRDSEIDGILVSDSLYELKGAIVDVYQAAALAAKLGLVVK